MNRILVSMNFPSDSVSSVGLLLARLLTGAGMMLHGLPKIQTPTTWAGDSIPAAFQLLAAVAEFGGGVAWILGLLVPLASIGVFITMAVAKFTAHANDPFISREGGSWELAGIYAAIAIIYFCVGPGRFSLDYLLSQKLRKATSPSSAAPV